MLTPLINVWRFLWRRSYVPVMKAKGVLMHTIPHTQKKKD